MQQRANTLLLCITCLSVGWACSSAMDTSAVAGPETTNAQPDIEPRALAAGRGDCQHWEATQQKLDGYEWTKLEPGVVPLGGGADVLVVGRCVD